MIELLLFIIGGLIAWYASAIDVFYQRRNNVSWISTHYRRWMYRDIPLVLLFIVFVIMGYWYLGCVIVLIHCFHGRILEFYEERLYKFEGEWKPPDWWLEFRKIYSWFYDKLNFKHKGDVMSEKLKDLEDVIIFLVKFCNAADSTYDGFQWRDLFEFTPAITSLPEAIAGFENVEKILDNLTEEERIILVKRISEMEFTSERSEIIAEQATRSAIEVGKLFVEIRNSRK